MSDIIKEIDKMLYELVSHERLSEYGKWYSEYQSRIIRKVKSSYHNIPPKVKYPTFERNLICSLFNEIREKEPHCEWPYVSMTRRIRGNAFADLVYIQSISKKLYQVWVEVSMYGSEIEKKYRRDFDKLRSVVSENTLCIGLIIHLEIFNKEKAIEFFKNVAFEYNNEFAIDVKRIGDKDSIHIVRLIIEHK